MNLLYNLEDWRTQNSIGIYDIKKIERYENVKTTYFKKMERYKLWNTGWYKIKRLEDIKIERLEDIKIERLWKI